LSDEYLEEKGNTMSEKNTPTTLVSVVMGSDSDFSVMEEALKTLDHFAVPREIIIASAHRSPDRASAFAKGAMARGIKVIIVGAGLAAHLPGVIASQTLLPVIGVPIEGSPLGGLDALLSIVQMPGGIPVATMAIGKAGARNAALMAVRILALEDKNLLHKLQAFIENMAREVERKQESLTRKTGADNGKQ
jgi:5-(carboxyamino)imidazole ribonucleotide mutase